MKLFQYNTIEHNSSDHYVMISFIQVLYFFIPQTIQVEYKFLKIGMSHDACHDWQQ